MKADVMLTECEICTRRYDPDIQQENCPHPLTEDAQLTVDEVQVAAAWALHGKTVKASFERGGNTYTVQSVTDHGLVTVSGLRGEFQPHWFYEIINPT